MRTAAKKAVKKVAEVVKMITAWSYSRFSDYEKCPALAKYKHVDKIKEPDNPAMAKGSRVHTLAEQYVGGAIRTLPPELAKFKKKFAELRKLKAPCEQDWAFNRAWNQVSWFASDAWLRVKMDVHYLDMDDVVHVIDHKTGRQYPEHKDQRSLYAIGAFLMYPSARAVVAYHWYLESGEEGVDKYSRADLPRLQKLWETRTVPMLRDTRFVPLPGNHCRWCHFRKSNGGPCKF